MSKKPYKPKMKLKERESIVRGVLQHVFTAGGEVLQKDFGFDAAKTGQWADTTIKKMQEQQTAKEKAWVASKLLKRVEENGNV